MKPFDLEAAIRGEPIQTRKGEPARFIAHVPEAATYKVAALINEGIETFTEEGTHCKGRETGFDLFMAPRNRTVWVNLYAHLSGVNNFGYFYRSEDDADEAASPGRIGGKAWPLEIEE